METVIVGAGLAGLACARRLHERGRSFRILSRDLGGRVATSKDGLVNYGANVVFGDNRHLLRHYEVLDPVRLRDICFHDGRRVHGPFDRVLLPEAPRLARLLPLLLRFRNAVREFREATLTRSQKSVIESDAFLGDLYAEDASAFVRRHGLERLAECFFAPHVWAFTFCRISDLNAFRFLQLITPLLNSRFLFSFPIRDFVRPFAEKVEIADVACVRGRGDGYDVHVGSRVLTTRNVVLATGGQWALEQAGLDVRLTRTRPHLFHITGTPRGGIARWRYHVFAPPSSVATIMRVEHGAYLVFSDSEDPPIDEFFSDVRVVDHRWWNDPGGTVRNSELVEAEPREGMYVIGGDLNVFYMEENFVTGLFAAERICERAS